MENEIRKEIDKLKEMIEKEEDKEKIQKQRNILERKLEEYFINKK